MAADGFHGREQLRGWALTKNKRHDPHLRKGCQKTKGNTNLKTPQKQQEGLPALDGGWGQKENEPGGF